MRAFEAGSHSGAIEAAPRGGMRHRLRRAALGGLSDDGFGEAGDGVGVAAKPARPRGVGGVGWGRSRNPGREADGFDGGTLVEPWLEESL